MDQAEHYRLRGDTGEDRDIEAEERVMHRYMEISGLEWEEVEKIVAEKGIEFLEECYNTLRTI